MVHRDRDPREQPEGTRRDQAGPHWDILGPDPKENPGSDTFPASQLSRKRASLLLE